MSGGAPRRSPWPVGLAVALGAFVMAVVGGALATSGVHVDLVSDRYYEEELRYEEQIERQRAALAQGAVPSWTLDAAAGVARLSFPATAPRPEEGEIVLYRPSDASLDRTLPLELDASGSQDVPVAELPGGLWRANLRWRAGGRDYAARQELVLP